MFGADKGLSLHFEADITQCLSLTTVVGEGYIIELDVARLLMQLIQQIGIAYINLGRATDLGNLEVLSVRPILYFSALLNSRFKKAETLIT